MKAISDGRTDFSTRVTSKASVSGGTRPIVGRCQSEGLVCAADPGGNCALAVVWSIVGRIPVRVDGLGILVNPGNVKSLQSPASGQVTAVEVRVGQHVKQGSIFRGLINRNCANNWSSCGQSAKILLPFREPPWNRINGVGNSKQALSKGNVASSWSKSPSSATFRTVGKQKQGLH